MNPPPDGGRARAPRGPLNWLVVAVFVVVALAVGVFAWWRQAEAVRLSNVRREANAKVLAEERAKNEAQAEAKRLEEQLERERKDREAAQAKQRTAEEALRVREAEQQAKPPSETPTDDSVATNRRKELADIANAGTLIGIKRDQAQELVRKVAAYREEKDGFEQHLAAFDAALEKLKAVTDPKTSAEIKTATTSATEAVDTMSLELKWLTDNRKGRDEAKRIEAEIVSSLDAELVRFKASEVAAFAFNDGTKLRQRGKSALAKGDFVAAGKDLSAAKAKLSAALLDAKAFFVSLAVSAAKQRKAAEQWEQCVAEAEKALAIDSTNAEAKALKDEANGHLVPTLRLVTRIGSREVSGAETRISDKACRTPLSWDKLTEGGRVGGYSVTYTEDGRRYVGTAPTWTVDWRGPRTMVVDLEEYKGPSAGDTKTVTLPGGAKLELVYCPPGSFMMGSPLGEEGRDDDETQHRVTLTKGFWIGKYEVTQRQWKSVMGTNQSNFKDDNRPVECVSWDDCQKFCRQAGLGLRLPTEAEWEYACRAGTTMAYFWGNALNGDRANCDGNYPCGTTTKGRYLKATCDVGSYRPNAWGICDMHGNVFEWCQDWYGGYGGDATDPTGRASGVGRVGRGGCWRSDARHCRSANRYGSDPGYRDSSLGFRVACSAGPSE